MGDYRKLKVWEQAHLLTLEVYRATTTFPGDERYGLTSQMRRAASSIPANIAEGCGRNGDAELARFLDIAMGSATELDYHLLLARDLAFLDVPSFDRLSAATRAVSKMLAAFSQTLRPPRPSTRSRPQRPIASS